MFKENKGAYSHLKLGRLTTDNTDYVNEKVSSEDLKGLFQIFRYMDYR